MQRLEVSGAVQPIYGSLGAKRLSIYGKVGITILSFMFLFMFLVLS